MPYNPHCPVDMPDIAWHHPTILKYDDCRPEAMGVSDLGHLNVTWPNGLELMVQVSLLRDGEPTPSRT